MPLCRTREGEIFLSLRAQDLAETAHLGSLDHWNAMELGYYFDQKTPYDKALEARKVRTPTLVYHSACPAPLALELTAGSGIAQITQGQV